MKRHKLLSLFWDISAGPSQLQSSLWPINFSLCPILLLPLNPIYYFLKIFIHLFGCVRSQLHHMGSFVAVCRLSSSGMWASLLQGVWDLSSQIKDRTHVPCIAREILNHWTNSSEVLLTLNLEKLYTLFCKYFFLNCIRVATFGTLFAII